MTANFFSRFLNGHVILRLLMVKGSCMARGAWLTAHGPWRTAHGSKLIGSRPRKKEIGLKWPCANFFLVMSHEP